MNKSEKRRLDAILESIRSKNSKWGIRLGTEKYTAEQLLEDLPKNKKLRERLLTYIDGYVVAEMIRDATRGKPV